MRGAKMHLLAVDQVLPRRGLIIAVENFEQCGLARAVLAQKCEHLAAMSGKADVVERLHARKVFGDIPKFQRMSHSNAPPAMVYIAYSVTSIARFIGEFFRRFAYLFGFLAICSLDRCALQNVRYTSYIGIFEKNRKIGANSDAKAERISP